MDPNLSEAPNPAAPLRIGGASGFWGDSCWGPEHLVLRGQVDFLVFDYLAELTMSVLSAARASDPDKGYATDFVEITLAEWLPEIVARGIRVVANAGGVNPAACARAVRGLAASRGLQVRVAVVEGDDVRDLLPRLRESGVRDLDADQPIPERVATANAYLGALPIRAALDAGAQIVITGRCVDSAVTLGALMHHFNWQPQDLDRLAQGSLAGHIIECGAQGSGGLFTDWESVPDWAHIGYPVLECHEDGSFVVTKPYDTGGLVTVASVAEQIVYEVGDPGRYLLPDVVCDFTAVRLSDAGPSRVRVEGARGLPPTPFYKVSATVAEGWRCSGQLTVMGMDAPRKARRTGEALLERIAGLLASRGYPPMAHTRVEVLGESAGAPALMGNPPPWEAVLRVSARHAQRDALQLFARELAAPGTSFAPGTTGASGRPSPSPVMRQLGFLIPKAWLKPRVSVDACAPVEVSIPEGVAGSPQEHPYSEVAPSLAPAHVAAEAVISVPLWQLAHGRSGDKGDTSNIGILARSDDWLPLLRAQLTEDRVAAHLSHLVRGSIRRYEWPGLRGFNFVCSQALEGGGLASMRHDALGKAMAQLLLTLTVNVPPEVAARLSTCR